MSRGGNYVTLWKVDPDQSRNLIVLKGHSDWLWTCTWSPNGSVVATSSSDGTARLWSLSERDGLDSYRVLSGHRGWVVSVQFSPDGRWVSTAGVDETVRIYRLTSDPLTEPEIILRVGSQVTGVKWHPDGRILVFIDLIGRVHFWSWPDESAKPTKVRRHEVLSMKTRFIKKI